MRTLTIGLLRSQILAPLVLTTLLTSATLLSTGCDPIISSSSKMQLSVELKDSLGAALANQPFDVYVTHDYADGSHSYWMKRSARTGADGTWNYTTDPDQESAEGSDLRPADQGMFIGSDASDANGKEKCFELCLSDDLDYALQPYAGAPLSCPLFEQVCGNAGDGMDLPNARNAGEVVATRTYLGFTTGHQGAGNDYRLLLAKEVSSELPDSDLLIKRYSACYNCAGPTQSALSIEIQLMIGNSPITQLALTPYHLKTFAISAYLEFKDGSHAYWGAGNLFATSDGKLKFETNPSVLADSRAFQASMESTNCLLACVAPGTDLTAPYPGRFPTACEQYSQHCGYPGAAQTAGIFQFIDRTQEASNLHSVRLFVSYLSGADYHVQLQSEAIPVSGLLVSPTLWRQTAKISLH